MKLILITLIPFFSLSCTTVANLKKEEKCTVWKERILLNPISASAGHGRASWTGECKNLWWDCQIASSFVNKNTGDVYLKIQADDKINWDQNKPIGKIRNNTFLYSQENPFKSLISQTPMISDATTQTVSFNLTLHPTNTTTTVVYQNNGKCSDEDALLGSLVVSAVEQLKSKNAETH
ncbi:MAG: hypothetical protein WA160_00235 [Pseudobdellovibrio sp.]